MDQKELDETERRKLQIEEEGLTIDRQKLALEEKKSLFELRFVNKHLPTLVTAILSVTAVIVSTIVSNTQLSVAKLQKDHELAQQRELASLQLAQQAEQHRLDWSVKIAEFVTFHADDLLSGDEAKRARIRAVIDVSFPAEIRTDIFKKLYDSASNEGIKSEWGAAAQKAAGDVVWTRQDVLGAPYSESFSVMTENRHGRPDMIASGAFSLSNKAGKIYEVRYSCTEPRCGWSYNPDPSKGYGIDYTISADGHSFQWRRKWDGDPVKESYTAFFQVPK